MKIIFAGTPEFALPVLAALHESQHQVVAVYTQPDRPAGRGRKLTPSPIKQYALQHGLTVHQPEHFNDQETLQQLQCLQADAMVVVGYGILLPITVLNTPTYGCINIHPSLLPQWRGPTPVQYALLNGDAMTGVSIMQLTKGMDAGPIYLQEQYTIKGDETAGQLYEILFEWGAELLLGVLDLIATGQIETTPQNNDEATYTHKIKKTDAAIDWHQSAAMIARQVRAYNAWPVAHTEFQGKNLRIWQVETVAGTSDQPPGTFIKVSQQECHVVTGDGLLRLVSVQPAGKQVMPIENFLKRTAI
ncbi:MAG: methionyl-tRNA formyltransferase [Gammaproteobacteria bacterium]|nr:methionyl-tRNA formyltransferase [Gammaproteobacteria bacterium]